MKILIGTANAGKQREYRELLAGTGWELVFPDPAKEIPELETGTTYRENAEHKARYFSREYGMPALADDSGIEVDALGGRPGVRSSRYCEDPGDLGRDRANNLKMLKELDGVPAGQRGATFRCVIVLADPGGRLLVVEGICRGYIMTEPRGENGFGYDPLFLVPEFNRSIAEIGPEKKNMISHRGRAARRLREKWPEFARETGLNSSTGSAEDKVKNQ